jgi:hypothetical protein
MVPQHSDQQHQATKARGRLGSCGFGVLFVEILGDLLFCWFIPFFVGFQPSKVVQDFFHPQYQGQL